jgi:hypothetical protein
MSNDDDSASLTTSPERRREFRLNRFLGAELIQGEQRRKTRFYIINISRTGLKATNQFSLEQSETHEFDLYLSPKQPPINLKAKLAWQKQLIASGTFEIGFEFVDLGDEKASLLEQFIESERQKPEPTRPAEPLALWTFQA